MSFDIQDGIFVTPWAVFIGRKAYDLTTLQEIKGLTRQNNITARNSFGKLSQHMTSNIGMNLPWVSKYFDVYFAISANDDCKLYMYYIDENQLKQLDIGDAYTFPFYEDEGGIFLFNASKGGILKVQRADNVYSTDQSEKKYIIRNIGTIGRVPDSDNRNIVYFLGVSENKAYFCVKGIIRSGNNYYAPYCVYQFDLVGNTVTELLSGSDYSNEYSASKMTFRDDFPFLLGSEVYLPIRYENLYRVVKYVLGDKSLSTSNTYVEFNTNKFKTCYNTGYYTYFYRGGNTLNINKDKSGKEYFTAISVNSDNPEDLTYALGEFICWASGNDTPIFNEYKVHQCIKVDNDTFFIGNGRLIKYLKWNAVKGNWEVINTFDVGELYSYFALDFTNKLWVISTSNKAYRIVPAQGVNLSATFEKDNYNYLGVPIKSFVNLKCSDINDNRLTIEQSVKLNGPVVFEDGTKEKLVQFNENKEITIPVIVNGHGSMSCSFAF